MKKKSIEQFLSENNIINSDKETLIMNNIDQVFNSYINADNEKIYNLEQQLVMIDILNNSVQTVNDSKDAQLSSIKNKLLLSKDLKKYANITNEFNDDSIIELVRFEMDYCTILININQILFMPIIFALK